MRNTRKSGQILRSKKRPHPTLRSGRGSRTNSNTSYRIQARVIEADSPSVVGYGGAASICLAIVDLNAPGKRRVSTGKRKSARRIVHRRVPQKQIRPRNQG